MTPANKHLAHKPASLAAQITHAERRLLDRRRALKVRLSVMGLTVRRQVARPPALLWAAALGFVAGEFTKRRVPTRAKAEPKTEPPRDTFRSLYGKAMQWLVLVRSLSRGFAFVTRDGRQDVPD